MRHQYLVLVGATAALLPTVLAWTDPHQPRSEHLLRVRQSNGDDADEPDADSETPEDAVCKPATAPDSPLPPCVSIEQIESACLPNGTSPLHYEAHAQCMCGGSFFAEKLACERCLQFHGLRSERQFDHYAAILDTAESALCSATPSAPFASLFSSAAAAATYPTEGATLASDRADGNTAVSLYFTLTGEQGPGVITGSAANATPTGLAEDDDDSDDNNDGDNAENAASDTGTASPPSATAESSDNEEEDGAASETSSGASDPDSVAQHIAAPPAALLSAMAMAVVGVSMTAHM